MTRRSLIGWSVAAVAAAAAITLVVYEEKKAKAATTTLPSKSGGLVFKAAAGGLWTVQSTDGSIRPITKINFGLPTPSVVLPMSLSSPMSTSAFAGAIVGVTIPSGYDLTQITALSQPAPIDASPTIPPGLSTGQGGTVLVTLTGYAGDIVFSGVGPDGTEFSALLHLTGFSKP